MRFITFLTVILGMIAVSQPAYSKPKIPSMHARAEIVLGALSGNTVVSYNASFGAQVEYHAPDGKTYFWYQGFPGLVTGKWKVEKMDTRDCKVVSGKKVCRKIAIVCYKYKRNPVNPALNKTDKKFDCQMWGLNANYVVEIGKGDIFNLVSGQIPFVLPNKKRKIRQLKKMMK
jgi:hypothetical protein